MVCPYCKRNRAEGDMPLAISMMIANDAVDAICTECMQRSPILRSGIEQHPVQNRLWYNGDKYLQYGTFFVKI